MIFQFEDHPEAHPFLLSLLRHGSGVDMVVVSGFFRDSRRMAERVAVETPGASLLMTVDRSVVIVRDNTLQFCPPRAARGADKTVVVVTRGMPAETLEALRAGAVAP